MSKSWAVEAWMVGEMNNKDENITIVGIEIPDGLNSQGTKVKLSDGCYLR
ncbi:MAG: hypothetical protein VX125_07955 [Pseudomonadota bacterium]|nr:hypothetical protein [Pseudomonadota bacterium]